MRPGGRRAGRDRAGALLRCSSRWRSWAGSPARCYKQFAVTIVIAVVLSGIVALTLTPALCAMLLKDTPHEHRTTGSSAGSTAGSTGSPAATSAGVGGVLGRPRTWLAAFARDAGAGRSCSAAGCRAAFIPTEDKGFFVIAIQLPDGASRQRTDAVVEQVEGILRKEPGGPNLSPRWSGFNLLAQANQTNGATMFVLLKPWDEREQGQSSSTRSSAGSTGSSSGSRTRSPSASTSPRSPASARRRASSSTCRPGAARTSATFARQVQAVLADSEQAAGDAGRGDRPIRANVPQVFVHVDRETAKARGVKLDGPLRDAAGDAVDALHQRLQPLRPDLPGAGRGAGAVPPEAGGHRPALRAQRRQRRDDSALRADPDRVPRRRPACSPGSTASPPRW